MKYFVVFLIFSIGLLGEISQVSALLIDQYTTHNELNQVIAIGDSFMFTMNGKDLERPLGFRLQYQNEDDVLKVRIKDPNGSLVLTSVIYDINEYQKSISAEFTPEYEGAYQVEVINIGQSDVSLNGYHGEMLTWKEIDAIQKEHGYSNEPYDPISVVLLFLLIGSSVGFVSGYFVSRRNRK
jgi:flagellar hook assembly protein FlgD